MTNPFKRPCERRHPDPAAHPDCLNCRRALDPNNEYAKLWASAEAPAGTVRGTGPTRQTLALVPCRFEGPVIEYSACHSEAKHVRHCMNDEQEDGRCTRRYLGRDVPGCDRCSLREPMPEAGG